MSNSSKYMYFLFSVNTSRNSFPPSRLSNSHQIECQYIQIISSYNKPINLLPFSLLSTSSLRFPFSANKFKIFLSFIPPYRGSNGLKKPSHPKTNFLLPVDATFTSGSHFRGGGNLYFNFYDNLIIWTSICLFKKETTYSKNSVINF